MASATLNIEVVPAGTGVPTGPMSVARAHPTASLLAPGLVLIAGGNDDTHTLASAALYTPGTRSWASTGSMSTARYFHTATLLPDGRVLVAGGEDLNGVLHASAEIYDVATRQWSPTGAMGVARSGHTATLLPTGQVLVAGGTNGGPPHAARQPRLPSAGLSATGSASRSRPPVWPSSPPPSATPARALIARSRRQRSGST